MATHMTGASWKRGATNTLICAAGVFVVLAVMAIVIAMLTGRTIQYAGLMAFAVLWAAVFTWNVVVWLIRRYSSGPPLLDCGPHPGRALFLTIGSLSAILGLCGAFGQAELGPFQVGISLFQLSAAVFCAILGLGRLEIREKGIWQYTSVLTWHKIESCEWAGKSGSTLLIRTKTKFPIFGQGELPVPVEHKAAMARLLQEHGIDGA